MPIVTETGIDVSAWNTLKLRHAKEILAARAVVDEANSKLQALLVLQAHEKGDESERQAASIQASHKHRQELAAVRQKATQEEQKSAATAARAAKDAQIAAKRAEAEARRMALILGNKALAAAEAQRKAIMEGRAQKQRDDAAFRRQQRSMIARGKKEALLAQSGDVAVVVGEKLATS